MAGNKDIHNDPKHNTNGFRQNPQNIGKGRKKKIYTILKESGYTADDIKTIFGEIPFYTLRDAQEAVKDESYPLILRTIAHLMINAFKNGDYNKIKEIVEHFIGKAPASVDVTSGGDKITQIFKIGDQEIEF